jgi:hypothetical protein
MSAATRLLLLLLMMMVLTRTVHCQDAQQIADRLWLGSCEASHNQSFVESEAIALIVTVTPAAECSQPLAGIVKYVRVDLLDDGSHALRPFLPLVQREIDAALVANRSVLLHCVQGISRSPAVAMAYLMLSRHWSLRTALSAVRDARPSVQPRFQLFDELLTLEREHFWTQFGATRCQLRADCLGAARRRATGTAVACRCAGRSALDGSGLYK